MSLGSWKDYTLPLLHLSPAGVRDEVFGSACDIRSRARVVPVCAKLAVHET